MVVFVTLFLALTRAVQPVSLAVEEPVVRVELHLDGRPVVELTEPPWATQVDFGPLRPHRLEAIGYDAEGREVDRAVQLVNLPHSRAESRILLDRSPERGSDGAPDRVRLVWETVEKLPLERAEVRFDGRLLEVDNPRQSIPLPIYDPDRQHHLVAELVFEGGLRTEAAVGLGGVYGGEVSAELTAVAVRRLTDDPLPTAEAMQGWFLHDGAPIPVRAVEAMDPKQGGAEVFVVRNRMGFHELRRVTKPRARGRSTPTAGGGKHDRLRPRDRGFLVHPVPEDRASRDAAKALFPISPALTRRGMGGLSWLLTRVRFRQAEPGIERLAAATAVAGLNAARGRPRLVVAVADPEATDESAATWSEVRRYLETLRVPLRVWSPAPEVRFPETWQALESVRSIQWPFELRKGIRDLRRELDSQAVIWVEGLYLPQEIELSEQAQHHVEWLQ